MPLESQHTILILLKEMDTPEAAPVMKATPFNNAAMRKG